VAFEENHNFLVLDKLLPNELIDQAGAMQPDIVVWKVNGAEFVPLLKELIKHCPMLQTVIIVENPADYDLLTILDCGIRGCLPMRLLPRQIVKAVELIVSAGIVCIPRPGPEHYGNRPEVDEFSGASLLTGREREVINYLAQGYSNSEIAKTLCLSESTIKSHLRSAFKKYNVRNRTEVLAFLYNQEKEKKRANI
jgi:DNA-binding NarL/FixJ family response regulator